MKNRAFHLFSYRNIVKLLLLLGVGVSTQEVLAQRRFFTNQQHFGVEEGLPQSYISGIVQDEDGFIWLSTLDGFCRYDGRGFKTFHYNAHDSTGLAANTLNGLGKLVNNLVTIYYSPTQADEFNLRTFKATRNTIRNRLAGIPDIRWQSYRFSYNSNNWFFTVNNNKGMGWLDGIAGKIHYASTSNGKLHSDTVSAIAQSPEGRIYVIGENGVQVSDTSRTKFEWYGFKTHIKLPSTKVGWDVFGEKFSIVGLSNKRVAMLDKNTITLLDINNKSTRIVPVPDAPSNAIRGDNGLQVDSNGLVYFEHYGRVYRLTAGGALELLWEHNGTPSRISSFFIDRSDVLWVSPNAQGLLRIDLRALHFESYRYRGNFISEMMEWRGSHGISLPRQWNHPDAGYYFRQAQDSKGNFYAGNSWYEQSGVFHLTSEGFRRFTHLPDQKTFTAILCMPGDEIWAFDQSEAVWYAWSNPKAIPRKLKTDAANFADVELADARYIGGYIWMSTYNHGLFQFDGKKLVGKHAGQTGKNMVPKNLTEICPDPLDKNKFWIGSRGGGLILWDAQKGLQRIYTIQDGLPNNTIYCILTDKKGRIWGSTNRGIFRLDPINGNVVTFEKTDGLQGNEFNRAHKFKLSDGRLVFGGLDGYTIFNPDDFEVTKKTLQVPVLLTGLQINNEPQDINIANSFIKQSLSTLSAIELPYDKNYLRFEFAALLFNQPQKTKYRYQLAGADKGWIENGYSNVASYSALPSGHYTFRLNATDSQGLWSNRITTIEIVIKPPFWATWWAWLIYALVMFALIRWYFLFREARLQIQQNLAFEQREATRLREVDELKDRFFSNITHEFRTPLTLIITPLEKLAKEPTLSTAALSSVKTAQRNSRQLLRLINEFLDFSKLNHGQLTVKAASGEISIFTADCVASFEANAGEKNITLSFVSDNVVGYYLFDGEKWEKIVTNLVGNALKFTPANGTVVVTLSSGEEDCIALKVSDNGPGVPTDQQEKIFTRFYQADDSSIRAYGGTGIGLSLVKELVELMDGKIQLDSQPGSYTSFVVTLPMKKVAEVALASSKEMTDAKMPIDSSVTTDTPILLLVEDNDELRAFLVETMSEHYRVLEASDGLKAWTIILEELPDIVISDVMMPGMDGFDLCKECKTDHRTAHIGFILLTSKAAHDARLKGLGTGADDYITKPFNLQELELRTANLVHLQQKQRVWLQSQLTRPGQTAPLPEVTDPFLTQLYKEMDDKLQDADLGVDYLCKAMGMSRSSLNRKLKALLDISPNDLIRQYRLQQASHLIFSGSDISSAAYQTGFSTPSYFSQCFKEQYGLTPSEWISRQG